MKYQWFLLGFIGLIIWGFRDNTTPKIKPVTKNIVQPKTIVAKTPPVKKPLPQIKQPEPLEIQSLSHEEFLEKERTFATEHLKHLVLGWCRASLAEVSEQFLVSTNPKASEDQLEFRKEGLNPKRICLNWTGEPLQDCFTHQAYCPSQFEETDTETLLLFFKAREVYSYERRTTDYKTYIINPDHPPFPDQTYWKRRAREINDLAYQIRGEWEPNPSLGQLTPPD